MPDYQVQLRALVYPEGDYLVAQCLDYDICAQAKTFRELQRSFTRIVGGHIELALQNNEAPFANIPAGPQELLEQYESVRDVRRVPLPRATGVSTPRFADLAIA